MDTLTNQRWIYIKRPSENVGFQNYQLEQQQMPTQLASDEVLIENKYISVDPYMRIQQSSCDSWEPPHPLNTLQSSGVVSKVLASNNTSFEKGDWVSAYTGWEQYSKVHASQLNKLDPGNAPVTTALGVLGMPGRTAWFGLMEAGKPKPGDIVAVSGAAGAVGSLVVQFAKKAGCKVIAFAGSEQKCQWLKSELDVDIALNYNEFDTYQSLSEYFQQHHLKIDIYFDNVGGKITDAVMPNINRRARIVICGQMSQYNGQLDKVELGPRFLQHMLYQRATIQGILARDYNHRMDEMLAQVSPWVKEGSLKFEQSIVKGFDKMPQHLASLFTRHSKGKLLVEVGK